jgi:DNA polymerase III epsilon subunit-like protein
MTYLAFVDTETTGLHPNRRPWEIAIIRRDLTTVAPEQSVTIQITDVDLSDADPQALAVGRFHDRHGLTGRLLTEARAAQVVEAWTRGAYLVGAVPSFDAETLDRMLRRHRLSPSWHHRLRCVETLASGHLRREVGGLKDAAKALGVPVDEAVLHTAMGDARLAAAVWDAVMGGGS